MDIACDRRQDQPFTAAELERWRDRLLTLRRELVQDADQLGTEALLTEPEARALPGSLQGVDLAAMAMDRAHHTVQLIDRALARIATGHPVPFGICEATGGRIEGERLELMPWTPVSSTGARQRERSPMPGL